MLAVRFFLVVCFSTVFCAYTPKDFSYLIGKSRFLNEASIKLHLTLYQGYVKNTQTLLDLLEQMEKKGEQSSAAYGALKRRVGWEFDGMRLHELFFENIGGASPIVKDSLIFKQIEGSFGSYELFVKSFKATALIRGIGWVILYKDPSSNRLINAFISEHDVGHLATAQPLCILDMWEHAYLTQYGLDKNAYIEGFLKEIDWLVVEQRISKL